MFVAAFPNVAMPSRGCQPVTLMGTITTPIPRWECDPSGVLSFFDSLQRLPLPHTTAWCSHSYSPLPPRFQEGEPSPSKVTMPTVREHASMMLQQIEVTTVLRKKFTVIFDDVFPPSSVASEASLHSGTPRLFILSTTFIRVRVGCRLSRYDLTSAPW